MKKYRLAVLISHPIQYHGPFFRKLAQNPEIDLTVYYCSDYGTGNKVDPGYGLAFNWDVPILEGYRHAFLKNYSPWPSPNVFWGLINPGIISELIKGKYDGVMIHGYYLASYWLGYLGAWLSGTPVLMRGEAVLRPNRRWWLRLAKRILLGPLFLGTGAFLAIGSPSRNFYKHYGVPDKKIFFTPYAVDNEYFMGQREIYFPQKREIKIKLGVNPDSPVILFVGKLIERKRPMDLIRAFQLLITNYDLPIAPSLVFAGDGELRKKLEEFVEDNKIKNVFFAGFKNQSEIGKCYSVAEVLVLPSSFEATPLVFNEAMCFKLPIITTDVVPSAVDFVKPDKNGFIYPVGDIDELVKCLEILLGNHGKLAKMSEESFKFISGWNYDAGARGVLDAMKFLQKEA